MSKSLEMSDAEIAERRDAALLRALSTPHKKQADMKVGGRVRGKKAPPAKDGKPKD